MTAQPQTAEATDAELVLAARAGDTSAFGALYARYARVVHAILLGKLSAPDADDATQQVSLGAHQARHAARAGGVRRLADDNRAPDRNGFPAEQKNLFR